MLKNAALLLINLWFFLATQGQDQVPGVVSGSIKRLENFNSKYITPRNIDIWLPEDYSASEKYAVLYMHDGQMLYDPDKTWNKQAWDVDDVVSALLANDRVRPFIVVGIWNGGETRHSDYFPQKPFDQMSRSDKDSVIAQLQRARPTKNVFQPESDSYLKFIVNELKPYIDKNYSVHTDRNNTCIAGSSMGGLISMYAVCEYPNIFGGAACLSTHWPGTFNLENNPVPEAFIKYLGSHLPDPAAHKIYFDCGDQTLDALYPAIQRKVDSVMRAKGFNENNWSTRYFPGTDHSEKAWKARLDIPIMFLFPK